MLSVTQSTVVFGTQFTLNIDVSVDEETPSTTIPVVSKSYTDPGCGLESLPLQVSLQSGHG